MKYWLRNLVASYLQPPQLAGAQQPTTHPVGLNTLTEGEGMVSILLTANSAKHMENTMPNLTRENGKSPAHNPPHNPLHNQTQSNSFDKT